MSIYISAAYTLKDALSKKATVKTAVYSSKEKDKKKLFALVCESLKHKSTLFQVIEKSDLLNQIGWTEDTSNTVFQISHLDDSELQCLAVVLLYDYLLGKGLGKAGRIRSLVTKHKRLVLSAFREVKPSTNGIDESLSLNSVNLPRYVRINTLKTTADNVINTFQDEGWELTTDFDPKQFYEVLQSLPIDNFLLDPIIPNMLVFPPRTDFHSHYLKESGAIILQDRASCLPAFVLNPVEGSSVIDCCAAPGNKTTHLAAIMNNTGKILAFDLSQERTKTLEEFVQKAGVTNTTIRCSDFLQINPGIKGCEEVQYILVDPSCSGSGIAERRNDLTDDSQSTNSKRLKKLSNFQSLILEHALTFPAVKRVLYSTCSIHSQENECVVDKVWRKFEDKFDLEYILPQWTNRGEPGHKCSDFCIRLNTSDHMTNGFFLASFVSKTNNLNTLLHETVSENNVPNTNCSNTKLDAEESSDVKSKKQKHRKSVSAGSDFDVNCDETVTKKLNSNNKLDSEKLSDHISKKNKKKQRKSRSASPGSDSNVNCDEPVTKKLKKQTNFNYSNTKLDSEESKKKKKKHKKSRSASAGGDSDVNCDETVTNTKLDSEELAGSINSKKKKKKHKKSRPTGAGSDSDGNCNDSVTKKLKRKRKLLEDDLDNDKKIEASDECVRTKKKKKKHNK